MEAFLSLSTVVAFVTLVVSIVGCAWPSKRPKAKKWAKWSGAGFVVFFIALAVVAGNSQEHEAKGAGFESAADQRAAKAAGYVDSTLWQTHKAEAAKKAAEDERIAKEKAAEDKRLAQEREAKEKAAAAEAERLEEERRAAAEAEEDAACRQDMACIGPIMTQNAMDLCPGKIEKLAKYSFEWVSDDRWKKFAYRSWKGEKGGTITLVGDHIRFQNGFGAWQNIVYECDMDPVSGLPLDVRAKPGRLN